MESGESTSGLYVIDLFGGRVQLVTVYCDMETDNGGWTAIQRRLSGTMNFNKTWTEFKNGFGDPANAYWIGNDVIHHLTNRQPHFMYAIFKLHAPPGRTKHRKSRRQYDQCWPHWRQCERCVFQYRGPRQRSVEQW
nr:fibrinogen-like protein A [Crassostrea gigas]